MKPQASHQRVGQSACVALQRLLRISIWPVSPRRAVWGVLVVCSLVIASLSATASTSFGAVTHAYLAGPSETITGGVPTGSGALLPGPVSAVAHIAGDSGHVWLSENIQYQPGGTRIDEFDASSGKYLGRQLNEEVGVKFLTEGLAVGHAFGEENVYIGAGLNERGVVAVYGVSSDALQATWEGTHTANGSFTEAGSKSVGVLDGIATDESFNPTTRGDVLVATRNVGVPMPAFNVVDIFAAPTGAAEPPVVGEIKGTCAAPGTCMGSAVPFREPIAVAVSPLNGDVFVLDGNTDECSKGLGECVIDAFEPVSGMPGVYSFLFKVSGTPNGAFKLPMSPAVASDGNVLLVEGHENVVDEFSPAGQYLGRLKGVPLGGSAETRQFEALSAVGLDPQTGDVFVGDYNHRRSTGAVDVFGPDLVIPDVTTTAVSGVKVTSEGGIGVVLNGTVKLDGEGPASCQFVYGASTAFDRHVTCTEEVTVEGPAVVHAEVSGLQPDTEYCFLLQATNKNGTNPGDPGADQCFTTPGPGLGGESVTLVSATSATLDATIDPHGAPTSYYFQYGRSVGYEVQTPEVFLGSGQGPVEVSRHVQSLSPSTVYHYRVVAISEPSSGETETFAVADVSFTTQATATVTVLPDGRQWELVSPVDKHGGILHGIQSGSLPQAAADGSAVTYGAVGPTEDGAKGYVTLDQVLSVRGSAGWSSSDISVPHSAAVGVIAGAPDEYQFFSNDLSVGLLAPDGPFTSLAPEVFPQDTERTPYIRDNATCATAPGTCYRPLLVGCPAVGEPCPESVEENADVSPGTKFGGSAKENFSEARIQGATPDLSHAIFSSGVLLAPPPHSGENPVRTLYEWSAGAAAAESLETISIKPDGTLARAGALGDENLIARDAVSGDGSHVVWSEELGGDLYERDVPDKSTIQLDVPEVGCGACGGSPSAVFQDASRDGSTVFFTDSQRLTEDAGEAPGLPDLYACEVIEEVGKPHCRLTDLTPAAVGSGEGADVQGSVLGTSQDGSVVYFVANGVLASGASQGDCHENTAPVGAGCNLYVVHRHGTAWGGPMFVATLDGGDWPTWNGESADGSASAGGGLSALTASVSGDGRFAAFMSERSLTGYDNRDAATGKPDEEVFVYDDMTGKLDCASCNPTGARPLGTPFGKIREGGEEGLSDKHLWPDGQGIAASLPGWTAIDNSKALWQSRFLTDEGRLFFDSSDALVPQDVNGKVDVYEYELAGVGDCTADAPTFRATVAGCVGLISSGASGGESDFVEAGKTGDDVFFLTRERLVSDDIDSAVDLYDAHVCSSGSPCRQPVTVVPACTTADACRAEPTPQPSLFGAPSSTAFEGTGNVPSPEAKVAIKSKALTPAQKLARALVSCQKKHKRARAGCVRQARRRYRSELAHGGKATRKGQR
jgi:hypothetical protein